MAAAVVLACAAVPGFSQRSTLRRFGTGEGLPSARVSAIWQDPAGFLWITTVDGIARFDGTRFDVFGTKEGLPPSIPNEVREDRRGRMWVALNGGGIARMLDGEPGAEPGTFRSFLIGAERRDNTVNALHFDAQDRLWIGTESGIARGSERADGSVELELLADSVFCLRSQAACATPDGAIWFAGARGLACVRDGNVVTHAFAEPSLHPEYLCVCAGPSGHVLVGDDRALWDFDVAEARWTRVPVELATNQSVRALLLDSSGQTWLCTTNGLIRLRGGEQMLYTTEQGLSDNSVRAAFEDRGGRLWFGTWAGGVVQFGRSDVVSWMRSDEMPNPDMTGVRIASSGRVLASTSNDGLFELDARGAHRLGAELSPKFDRVWRRYHELPGRGWVLGTDEGLWFAEGELPDLARARQLGAQDGYEARSPILVGSGCAPDRALAADNHGRIQLGAVAPDGSLRFSDVLSPADRGAFDSRANNDALRNTACAPDGTLWLTSRYFIGRVAGGKLEALKPSAGLPSTEVRDLAFDPRGRLWVALRRDGVSRCDDPAAKEPQWTHVESLAGESTFAIAANRAGHVFVGTWSGVHELDPDGKLLHHFTSSGGLASDIVNSIVVDADDRAWIATSAGVTRLEAGAGTLDVPPPAAWIARVDVDGESVAIPRRAARSFGPLELAPGQHTLLVEFCAPWFASEEPLQFQLMLAGVDSHWSKPQRDRQVRFAGLSSGDHRLSIRTVLGPASAPGEPATLTFRIAPPFWRRPWVVALAVLLAAGALFALHRFRLRQALALERVRSQIALDLHDELGADLTQVAILAELARRDAPRDDGVALQKVAGLAREMRESLADIVWSVDPRRDRVGDLVARLREVGNQLVEAGGIEFALTVETDRAIESLPIAPTERRGLFLIVKESLNNAVKHAQASRIDVGLRVRGSQLSALVRDDGRGFDPERAHSGHGLRGLRTRAAALGARLELRSRPGSGTEVALELDLRGGPA